MAEANPIQPAPHPPALTKNDSSFEDPIWHRWFDSIRNGINKLFQTAEFKVNKDQKNGYAGLGALYEIHFLNQAGTFTSLLTNFNTAARTYTFPNRTDTVVLQNDNVTFAGLTVNGTSTLVGSASVALTLSVGGTASIGGDLAVTGRFGCNGASVQARQVLPADATDLPTAIALVNALKASGIAFGFNS